VRRFVIWSCVHTFDGPGDIGQLPSMRVARMLQRKCHDARTQMWMRLV